MKILCPNCARVFEAPQSVQVRGKAIPVGAIVIADDGTAFRQCGADEERHIDMRIRCDDCSVHQR